MFAEQLLQYSSVFVIGYFMGAAAITYFAIPFALMEYTKQFCRAVSRTYTPAFTQLYSGNNADNAYSYYISGTRLVLLISNLFCVGLYVLGGPFISIWMGEVYAIEAEPLLFFLFLTLYFYTPQLISYALLKSLNKHQSYSYIMVAASLLTLLLSIKLVSGYGLLGVTIGMAVPQILLFGLIVPLLVSRMLGKSYPEYLRLTHVKMLIPTTILFLVLFIMKQIWLPANYVSVFTQASMGALVYLSCSYSLALTSPEREYVDSFFIKTFFRIKLILKPGSRPE